MTVLDGNLMFSDDQALTSLGSAASTNVVNMGAGYDEFGSAKIADYGESGRLWLNVRVTEDFSAGASTATLKFALQDCTGATGTYANVFEIPAIDQPDLTAGASLFRGPIPTDCDQFLRLLFTVGTTAFTGGKVSAWLGLEG